MNKTHHQIIIVGAGIAGLWSFNVLRTKGYDVILLEKDTIGGVQSMASQGMIHGGQRYALQGVLNSHSESIAAMPGVWDQALKGEITPNLSSAKILSSKQYMWSPGGLTSNVTSFFASKAMNSRVDSLDRADWPEIFKAHAKFKGKIYELDEVVLDIQSVASALSKDYLGQIIKIDQLQLNVKNEKLESVIITQGSEDLELTADQFIFTAGLGNEDIASLLWPNKKTTQRRPLKQVLVDDVEFPLYAHCITVDPRPRVTVSAHPKTNGKYTWYLGGLVAVKHITDSDEQAIDFAKQELKTLFPFIDWDNKKWSTLLIDRAEPYTSNGFLPEGPAIMEKENTMLAWPTKLTFAPAITNKLLNVLDKQNLPTKGTVEKLKLASPKIGTYPWESATWQ